MSLQGHLSTKENELVDNLTLQEKKNVALLSDLRFMRDENQKLHEKVKEANECVILMEQQVAQAGQEQAREQMAKDSLKRQVTDQDSSSRAKDLKIAEVSAELQAAETGYFHKFRSLQTALSNCKQEHA